MSPTGNVSVYLPVTDSYVEAPHEKFYAGIARIKVQNDVDTIVEIALNPISKVLAFKLNVTDGEPEHSKQILALCLVLL